MTSEPDEAQSPRSQVVDWLMRLEAAPHDRHLRAAFEAWLAESERHRSAYRAVEPIWRASAGLAPSVPSTVVPPRRRPMVGRGAIATAGLALAACLALWFVLPVVRMHLQADHVTGVAEQRDLVLDDGSRVALDGGSAIGIRYDGRERRVTLLAGEAFFEVVPDRRRPFVVHAGEIEVTVTGTAFSVGTARTGVTVAVQSGTVAVALGSGEPAVAHLERGQRFRLDVHGGTWRDELEAVDVAAWRSRRLVVHDVSVRDLVEQIGRHHRGFVVFRDSAIAERRVTGLIDLDRPVEALHALVELHHGSLTQITPLLAVIASR